MALNFTSVAFTRLKSNYSLYAKISLLIFIAFVWQYLVLTREVTIQGFAGAKREGGSNFYRGAACPAISNSIAFEPYQVFYTGVSDSHMRTFVGDKIGAWPDHFEFFYFNDTQLEESVRQLDAELKDEGIVGLYAAFKNLKPFAFRADLWRYAILYVCGGIYGMNILKTSLGTSLHNT